MARAYLIVRSTNFSGRSVSVHSPLKDVHPSIQHSAELRPNIRHSFGELAQTFGFGQMS